MEHLYSAFLKPEACNFIKKEPPTQLFSYEFCETFKNTFFHRTPPVAASGFSFDFSSFILLRFQAFIFDNARNTKGTFKSFINI